MSIFIIALQNKSDDAKKNQYFNPALGFRITKPTKWHFAPADEVAENLERTKFTDESFDAYLKAHATFPIVAIMKHEDPYDDLNPTVKVNVRLLGDFPADKPIAILEFAAGPLSQAFSDFQFVTKPRVTKLAGLKAANMCVSYTLANTEGRKFPTLSTIWIVPRRDFFFMIGTGCRQDDNTGGRDEIQRIIETIIFEPIENDM